MKKIILSTLIVMASFMMAFSQNLVITEIMYNDPAPGVDSLEFVEIYNAGTTAVNLKDFTFRTAFNDTLPSTNLAAGGYYVVAVNAAVFKSKFGFAPGNQWKNGALNNAGERIDLYSAAGVLVDSVRYSATLAPWPLAANGQGPSLVLCDVTKDNGNGANWATSTVKAGFQGGGKDVYASPGKADCVAVTVKANSLSYTTSKAISVNIPLAAMASPASAVITITKQPANGTLTLKGTNYEYLPNSTFCGKDAFDFKATIGANSDMATVSINVVCQKLYPVYGIGKVTADGNNDFVSDSLNVFCEVVGVVHGANFATSPAIQFCIIDAANKNDGITVDRVKNFGYTPKEGDKIRVQGKISSFNGLALITPDTIIVNGTGTLFAPTTVTKLDETTENVLVEMKNLTLTTPAQWVAAGQGFTVDASDGTNKIQIRVDKDIAALFASVGPKTNKFDCIGIGYQFSAKTPANDAYQLNPRKLSDMKIYVGTNDVALGAAVSVFPNPFQDEIVVNLTEKMDRIFVSDAVGRLVTFVAQPTENQTITTSSWANGVYFITVEKDGRQFTTKIVK
jgi:hypothetical protein